MLTRKDILQMVQHRTYIKGEQIYRDGRKVLVFDVEEGFFEDGYDDFDQIYAMVRGSRGNVYDVFIEYDPYKDAFGEANCSCPAFETYEGPCKHCVAVLLEYEEYLRADPRMEGEIPLIPKNGGHLHKGTAKKEPEKPKTTPAIKALLGRETLQKTAPLLQKDTYGKVRLAPEMTLEQNRIKLRFRIGASQMYVLKDVFEFARNMEAKKDFSYGKKLKFIHTMGSFDPESRPLAEFILRWARENEDKYLGRNYYSYYYMTEPRSKELSLNTSDFEEFAEIMESRPFSMGVEGERPELWHFEDGAPVEEVEIRSVPDGIELAVKALPRLKGVRHDFSFGGGTIYRQEIADGSILDDFYQCADEVYGEPLFVEKADVPAFCREILPQLKNHFVCRTENFDENDYGIVPARFEFYLDAPEKDFLTCRAMACYGEKSFNVMERRAQAEQRDLTTEIQTAQWISEYFTEEDEVLQQYSLYKDEAAIYRLLTEGIETMEKLGTVFISEALKRLQVKSAPTVTVGVSLSGDMLDLTVTSGDMSKADLIEILTRYDRKKKYFRLKNGDFIQIDNEGLDTVAELYQGLHLTAKELAADSVQLPKYRALYLDHELAADDYLPVERDKAFRALVRGMKTVDDNDFEVPASLQKILRSYQKKGFLWLKTLAHNGFGGILADDMGLGKTLQVIAFLLSEYEEGGRGAEKPSLIVCPSSLVYNWKSELARFAPELTTKVIAGTAAEREQRIAEIGPGEIAITSYDLLKRDVELYEDVSFFAQVIDEAQYIKNPKTKGAKAVKEIRASFKAALTGTPVENRLSELWSIFDYLMPGFLFSYDRFRKEMEVPIAQNQDEEALHRLQKMIRPFVLRRVKADVLRDLPEKIEENYMTRLEGEQQKLYDAHVKELQLMLDGQSDDEFNTSKIKILSQLTRLRQLCCDPGLVYENYTGEAAKVDMCMDLVENAVDGGHKILLFSQFTTMLDTLQQHLAEAGISYYKLTGATGKQERMDLVERFNRDDTQVFLISLKAGGTGLNLTAADIVIHFDPWWNIAVQNQATDRAHRIGQKKVVNVYKLVAEGTIEENIIKLQERKRELADQLLTGDGMGSASFSKEELLELLG